MAKVQVKKAGITLTVEDVAVDYYLRTGYKVVKTKPEKQAVMPALLKVQLVEPEPIKPVEVQPAPESPAVEEKPKRKTRKKKAE